MPFGITQDEWKPILILKEDLHVAPGPDGLLSKALKELANVFWVPITTSSTSHFSKEYYLKIGSAQL